MAACPSCKRELPGEFPFCPFCGAALAGEAPAREERKVVTAVFCDLVGSTAQAERLDPEDVRALLSNYHTRVREQLERFGGTVEKFIGDAVVAFFGAPVAHEDDPERAVRAALAIRDWAVDEPDLHVRIGVNTGEALVALGARPHEGEGMASGDVINTAARLQSAAAVDGILVGEQTFRATERAIAYRISKPVAAKGKAEPVPAWEALEARSRFGIDVARPSAAQLVGRDREVELLVAALERAVGERTPQLVTLVGVPGIGKSRLLAELFHAIERDQRLVTWRQGRSLPYGEGVSFWAVGEMVKAQAGVLETDTEAEAAEKLGAAVGGLLADEAEARWVTSHLRPLAGLAGEVDDGGAADRRSEAFAAWRRFFEALAEQRPLVLVFEDLHWADDGLLDFVDQMADRLADIPVLLVATARPELLARRPSWGGGKANAVTLSLAPLSDDDTARLVHSLLERSVLPAEVQAALLERAGGNPLYAEEFVRMTSERGSEDLLELPESVQGIIAARVDALDPRDKALLQDAAVVGKVFWSGALTAITGRDRFELEERLYELERRELVRRERRSSVEGESEYAFRHVLLRDVAYGSIPRAARVERHRLAAGWIESLGRPDDHADLLTYHYLAAIELARAAGVDASAFAGPAAAALLRAADRALALNAFAAAAQMYDDALALGLADEDQPRALLRRGVALNLLGDPARVAVFEEARDRFEAAGDDEAAGEASAMLAEALWYEDRTEAFRAALSRAQELVQGHEPSAAVARVRAQTARYAMLDGRNDEAIRVGRETLGMAERLGLDELRANLLTTIGSAMSYSEPGAGDEMLREAIAIGTPINSIEASRALNNLAASAYSQGSINREHELLLESRAAAERVGSDNLVRFAEGNLCFTFHAIGDWDESLRRCDAFIAECEAGSAHNLESIAQSTRAQILLGRDDLDGAVRASARDMELAGGLESGRGALGTYLLAARVSHELGRLDDARAALLVALEKGDRVHSPLTVNFVLLAEPLGLSDRVEEFLGRVGRGPWLQAAELVAAGKLSEAARRLDEAGHRSLGAQVRLRSEEDEELEKAIEFFASAGATRYLTRAEAQLAAMA